MCSVMTVYERYACMLCLLSIESRIAHFSPTHVILCLSDCLFLCFSLSKVSECLIDSRRCEYCCKSVVVLYCSNDCV